MIEPDHLFSPEITAHCFWSPRCAHRVTGTPQYVHDAMEVHYRTAHRGDLDPILEPLITYACPPGGLVLDLFAGSCSTAVAARGRPRLRR